VNESVDFKIPTVGAGVSDAASDIGTAIAGMTVGTMSSDSETAADATMLDAEVGHDSNSHLLLGSLLTT
jgi:hypothetical protein